MLNAGVPATEAARRLGHSVAMLLKRYANCVDGQEQAANDRIARALGMAVYERLGAGVRPLNWGLASRLRTSHGPAGPGQP